LDGNTTQKKVATPFPNMTPMSRIHFDGRPDHSMVIAF
jgi:hypothetical protein